MKRILLFLFLVFLSGNVLVARDDYDVYLLIGQSNAVGFAPLEKGDENVVEGVYLLDSLGKVVPMSGVMNRFSSLPKLGNRMGFSLGVTFAQTMHKVTGRRILMVSNAKGATSIGQWLPDAEDPLFYDEAVRRTRQAMKYGRLKGILWHQACGDARWTGKYTEKAIKLFSSFRKDFKNPNLPVVVGEAGHWFVSKDKKVTSEKINAVLRALPDNIPSLGCVTSEGCKPIYDVIHFNHEALELLGRRYAAQMLSLQTGRSVEELGSKLGDLKAKDPEIGELAMIAYSKIDNPRPINTMEHFEAALESGFKILKTDMQLTSDGEIVLCHDNGFTLDENGRIISFDNKNKKGTNIYIDSMTVAQVKSLEHAKYFEEMGHYAHVATLEEFFAFCKERNVKMYTTIRNHRQKELLKRYKELVDKYGVEDLIMMNNYKASDKTLAAVRAVFPKMPYCYTLGPEKLITKELVDMAAEDGNIVLSHSVKTLDLIPEDVLAYAKEKGVKLYGHFVTGEGFDRGFKMGMCGFQINYKSYLRLAEILTGSE